VLRAGKSGIEVACLTGSLIIDELQLAGKNRLDAASFLAGYGDITGVRLTDNQAESDRT
jgi:methionyl-tRNA formyltransferase